jgi:hypothetical protein
VIQEPDEKLLTSFRAKIARMHQNKELHQVKQNIIEARELMLKKDYLEKLKILELYEK